MKIKPTINGMWGWSFDPGIMWDFPQDLTNNLTYNLHKKLSPVYSNIFLFKKLVLDRV